MLEIAEVQVHEMTRLTGKELDFIENVSIASSLLGALSLIVFFSCLFYIAIRTELPGRLLTLFSAISWVSFYGFTYYKGGNLDLVFGPIGMLYDVIAYSLILTIFSVGFFRMSMHFKPISDSQKTKFSD